MDKIVSLCKRRGFIFPGSEIYGGFANSWDYGPYGVELKNNIKQLWWKIFVHQRDDIVGIDAALIMNPKVWETSGHIDNFTDPLIECKKCHARYRDTDFFEDGDGPGRSSNFSDGENRANDIDRHYQETLARRMNEKGCQKCGGKSFAEPKSFNLMFKTFIGPAEEQTNVAYFRPETAQAMFVDFKNVLETSRKSIPFGIAQIGKAFRNEITPGNFIFRTREFEQMEIEYFIEVPKTDEDWNSYFESWRKEMHKWLGLLGISDNHIHELEVSKEELAHYSKKTIDFEYDFPFGKKELYGLAYRTNFDLTNHQNGSGQNLEYTDTKTNEKYIPHVIEPTWGVDRSVLAVLCESYCEEKVSGSEEGDVRVVLKLPKNLAPIKIAIFPLLKNKPELVAKAREVFGLLKNKFVCEFDDNGNIGKRYRRQDEIGTPYCVTVDFDTLQDGTVTVRDRDSMEQPRVAVSELTSWLEEKLNA